MPKVNILKLLLCSSLFLSILSIESVNYDGKSIEDMKSSIWNSNSEGFYLLNINPISKGETIIALTSMNKDVKDNNGYTDIITYKISNDNGPKTFNFYLYEYDKEKLEFHKNKDTLFSIKDGNNEIESIRNLYVGNLYNKEKCYLASFIKKGEGLENNKKFIHYLRCGEKQDDLKGVNSNILILNRNTKDHGQILYQDEDGYLKICVIDSSFQCGSYIPVDDDENNKNCKISENGGLAYVDVSGNCSPDIIISCDDKTTQKRLIRIYTSNRDADDKYNLRQTIDNIGESDELGPFIISRINNDKDVKIAPQLDILIPIIKTGETKILALKNKVKIEYDWENVLCNEDGNDDTNNIFERDNTEYVLEDPDNKIKEFDSSSIAILRPGDFLSSGTPGLLVKEKIKDKTVISLYEKTSDKFKLHLRISEDGTIGEPKNAIFFDINESGSLGLIIENKNGDNKFIYNYRKNVFFVKSKLMNDKEAYYDANVGASFRFIVTSSDGERSMDISYQMAQTSDNNIPLPFSLVGLGETSNYIEYFQIISGNYYKEKDLFEDEEYRNFKTQTPIIPNTQMAVFKFKNEDSKYDWYLDLFVLPTDSLIIIAAVIVVVMLIILGIIIYLHVREVKEEQKETNKFKSWFA